MPWKDNYTISDETTLCDKDVRWPDGRRCAVHIVVDLSVASGPAGISATDLSGPAAQFATTEGLDLLFAALAKHALRATFAVPAVICRTSRPPSRSPPPHRRDPLARPGNRRG